jgi:hypothetical protein
MVDRLNAVHRALILRAVRDAASDHRPEAATGAAAATTTTNHHHLDLI